MASLIISSGPQEGLYLPLGNRTAVVGRDEGVALQLEDQQISRKHFQVRPDGVRGGHVLLDMKSANGTYVNGRRVMDEVPLADNDEVRAGGTTILYTLANPADKANAMSVIRKAGERHRGTLLEDGERRGSR